MKLKIGSKMAASAEDSLGRHARALYEQRGRRIVGVIELAHLERTEPADDADTEPSVRLKITSLEVANHEQEPHLRDALRALWRHRTAQGTLDDEGEVTLSERVLEMTAGMLDAVEAARLRAVVNHWREYTANAVLQSKQPTVQDLLAELRTIRDGLKAGLDGASVAEVLV